MLHSSSVPASWNVLIETKYATTHISPCCCLSVVITAVISQVARPATGPIRGVYREHPDGSITTNFLGIPYATPPVGALRFTRPQPYPVWEEVRPADTHGDSCEQLINLLEPILPPDFSEKYLQNLTYSEDCLSLNVFYPGNFSEWDEGRERAVMVWIHGGAFILGQASFRLYEGDWLANYGDVIVVSIHYRLNLFGFGGTEDGRKQVINGYFDQVLALKWIHENIEAFGGNPNEVTLFGESAGASSVAHHMISPMSSSYFQRAIGESGAVNSRSIQTRESRVLQTKLVMEKVGCFNDTSEDPVECLRSIPADVLMEAQADLLLLIGPAEDGEFITSDAIERLWNGDFDKVPGLWGTNPFESNIYLLPLRLDILDTGLDDIEATGYILVMASQFENSEAAFIALSDYYFPDDDDDPMVNLDRTARMLTDSRFESGKGLILDVLSNHNVDAYEYYFTHR